MASSRVMLALEKIATWDDQGRCWIKYGMGALRADGSIVTNSWNRQPAPLVEPLVTYYLATHDPEGLKFARAYADGIIANCQPGIRFHPNGTVTGNPHSHATMHAVWGVAHLGVVTGDSPLHRLRAWRVGLDAHAQHRHRLVSRRPG